MSEAGSTVRRLLSEPFAFISNISAVPGVASYHRFDQRTRHGGVGDPRPSTAEKGQALLDASADEVAAQVREIRALTPFG